LTVQTVVWAVLVDMILFIHCCPKDLRVRNALSTYELRSEEGKGSGCPELRGW